jgi:SAM-dependent MidA family methyltransferase
VNTIESLGNVQLVQEIIAAIEQCEGSSISFHDYMNMCLYHQPFGYYMKSESKIGREGDFYTSASIGPFMGQMLAVRFAQYFSENNGLILPLITEWGSGTGRLASHILDELQSTYPNIYNVVTYELIDVSPYHQERQRERLQDHIQKVRFVDPDSWWTKKAPYHGIIFSNELLDAFPIHLVKKINGRYQEVYVGWEQTTANFYELYRPISPQGDIAAYLEQFQISGSEGHTVEINLAAQRWIRSVGAKLRSGMLITIDYGDDAKELYASHRHNGTLMCYHQHLAHSDPYIHVGDQDITSHVNFSACIHSGEQSGLTRYSFHTQRKFLIEQGILFKLQDHAWTDPFHPVVKRNRAIRQLLLGDSMSELFKILIQYKKGD